MKLFFLAISFGLLISCQSHPDPSADKNAPFSNPIRLEYSLTGEFTDYQYFKNSQPQFVQRCFERAKRWALLKEGPDVLSAVGSDVIEGVWTPNSTLGPDATMVDWMPWWMDLLKIDVSALIISKTAKLNDVSEQSCVQIYLERLEEGLKNSASKKGLTALSPLPPTPPPASEDQKKFSSVELWKNASPTQSKEFQVMSWLAQVQIPSLPMKQIREFYFTRLGIKRRLLLLRNGSARPTVAIELVQDPYQTKTVFSKSGQNNLCNRVNLALSVSKISKQSVLCSDLEGQQYGVIDESFLEAIFRKIDSPLETDAKNLYREKCRALADFHASQWMEQDLKYLTQRLRKYPQIKKRLAYFAAMEAKEILATAAKNRGP